MLSLRWKSARLISSANTNFRSGFRSTSHRLARKMTNQRRLAIEMTNHGRLRCPTILLLLSKSQIKTGTNIKSNNKVPRTMCHCHLVRKIIVIKPLELSLATICDDLLLPRSTAWEPGKTETFEYINIGTRQTLQRKYHINFEGKTTI